MQRLPHILQPRQAMSHHRATDAVHFLLLHTADLGALRRIASKQVDGVLSVRQGLVVVVTAERGTEAVHPNRGRSEDRVDAVGVVRQRTVADGCVDNWMGSVKQEGGYARATHNF